MTEPIDNALIRFKAYAHWKKLELDKMEWKESLNSDLYNHQMLFLSDVNALLEAIEVQRKALEQYADTAKYSDNFGRVAVEAIAEAERILKNE